MKKEPYITNYFAVHAFFLNGNGETLILQRASSNKYKPLFWDIPGGKMLLHEDINETIIREVKEETGLEIEKITSPLSVYVNREQLPDRKDIQLVVSCTIKDEHSPITINPREHCQYMWINPCDLPNVNCMDYLKHFYNEYIAYEN